MFDLGWQEFLMVAVVLMLVVGPKDMPRILRSFSQFMRKARSMANEFTSTMEEASRQSELRDVTSFVQDVKSGNFDEMTDLIDGDVKTIADDLKTSAGLDDVSEDLKQMSDTSKSDASNKPKSAKAPQKKAAKKKTASKKKAAKKAAKKKQS